MTTTIEVSAMNALRLARAVLLAGVFLFILASGGIGEGFLRNSGGEDLLWKGPVGWSRVGLYPGVTFAVDDEERFSGQHSLTIISTDPAVRGKEPPPNWSQEIVESLPRGRHVVLTAVIKTRNVANFAAVAIQCLSYDQQKILVSATTGPLLGNTDWKAVSCALLVPQETDKVRVFCLLSGTGQAWFDDIELDVR
ncbi:MAG: hypothetical protein V2A78_05985 [bacterium]